MTALMTSDDDTPRVAPPPPPGGLAAGAWRVRYGLAEDNAYPPRARTPHLPHYCILSPRRAAAVRCARALPWVESLVSLAAHLPTQDKPFSATSTCKPMN